jgi:hypothetical protein
VCHIIRYIHELNCCVCIFDFAFVHALLLRPCILQPKAYAYFELITPEVYSSPRAVAALKLFQMSVDDALSEYRLAILTHTANVGM